jgi:ribonuclease P protein component
MRVEEKERESVTEATKKVASFAFPASERLHLEREISALFKHGKRAFVFPYRATYSLLPAKEGSAPILMMAIVPKRVCKHAVDRNRNKRRIREAFRLQANPLRELLKAKGLQLHLAFLLVANEEIEWQRGHAAVAKLLTKILHCVEKE